MLSCQHSKLLKQLIKLMVEDFGGLSSSASTTDLSSGFDSGTYLRKSPDQYSSRGSMESLDNPVSSQHHSGPQHHHPLGHHSHGGAHPTYSSCHQLSSARFIQTPQPLLCEWSFLVAFQKTCPLSEITGQVPRSSAKGSVHPKMKTFLLPVLLFIYGLFWWEMLFWRYQLYECLPFLNSGWI